MTHPRTISIDIDRGYGGQDDITVVTDITDAQMEQAYSEIMDDDRLQQDVITYCTDDHSPTMAEDWYTNEHFLRLCILFHDNDEAFKKWWNERHADRVYNRAVDLCTEQYLNRDPDVQERDEDELPEGYDGR